MERSEIPIQVKYWPGIRPSQEAISGIWVTNRCASIDIYLSIICAERYRKENLCASTKIQIIINRKHPKKI